MLEDSERLVMTIFGGILALAVISVIISRKSRAPEAIQAFSSGLTNIVAAAVAPQATAATNGNLGSSVFSTPNIPQITPDAGSGVFGALGIGSIADLK